MQSSSKNLDFVLSATNGSLFVTLAIYAYLIGCSEKSFRNRPASSPIPLKKLGGRVGVSAVQLADLLDKMSGEETKTTTPAPAHRRGRGRPRKIAARIQTRSATMNNG